MRQLRGRELRSLVRVSAVSLVRDPTAFFFVLVFPFLFLGLYYLIAYMTSASPSPSPTKTFDAIRFGMPAILTYAFASLAFFGTASTIIQLRQNGTLRLLQTTPMSRLAFFLSQVPPRLAIAAFQLAVMCGVAAAYGFLGGGALARVLLTSLLALLMLFSCGFLLGGVVNSAEAANGIVAGALPLILMFSGVFIPLEILPKTLQQVAQFSPLTYLADALRQDLVGSVGLHPIATDYLVMGVTAAVLTAIAVRTFRWDGPE